MKTRRLATTVIPGAAALVLATAFALAACGGPDDAAAPAATAPAALPAEVSAPTPTSQLDGPGQATVMQTVAVARKYATALTSETIPGAGLYSADATWDYWPGAAHQQGDEAIEAVYADAATSCDWSEGHVLVSPGLVAYEGMFDGGVALPALALLAVDDDRIVHEEIFFAPGPAAKAAVTFCGTAPGPGDSAAAASDVAAAVGEAVAAGDTWALQELLAADILFYDTGRRHGVRGVEAVLDWQSRTPSLDVSNQPPMGGRGWACVRWTVRRVYPSGGEVVMPGATVMEIRDGKVARMTLYYDSALVSLQD